MGSDIIPVVSGQIIQASDNGYQDVQNEMNDFAAAAERLQERIAQLAREVGRDVSLADRLSEMCGVAQVDPRQVAQIAESANAIRGERGTAVDLASASSSVPGRARAVAEAHRAEYGGINERVNASGAQQAVTSFYRTQ